MPAIAPPCTDSQAKQSTRMEARYAGWRAYQIALKASTALVPPKAKLLLSAARTLRSRATFGVTSRSHSGRKNRRERCVDWFAVIFSDSAQICCPV